MNNAIRAQRLGLVLLGAGLALTSRAQGYAEGLTANYEYLPLKFKNTEQPAFHADVYRASAILPVAQAPDSSHSFLAGAGVELLRFGGARPGFPVATVYGLSPVLGYRQRVTPQLELTALLLPALNSDLRQVRGEDVRLGGVVRGVYRVSPRLAYRATVGYRSQFYGPQYVLLLGLDWQPGGRWRVFGDLPTSLTASYALSPRTAAGFVLTGINTAYRLQEGNRYFQYQQAHYGLFAEQYASAHWVVRATVAYAVTRRLDVYDQTQQWPATLDYIGLGQAPIPVSEPLSKGLAVKVALSYRVPQ